MTAVLVLGAMWGDEGKAKIVDYLASDADFVVRFQGGSNAGHTIVTNNNKYVLHTIPSGILYPETKCLIGAGVLIDPAAVIAEIKQLEKAGISFKNRLVIDFRAGVVLPIHKQIELKNETRGRGVKIGTTQKGIGPAYSDLTARYGIRMADIANTNSLKSNIKNLYSYHHIGITKLALDAQVEELLDYWKFLKKYVGDVEAMLHKIASQPGKNILFEGAQGTLLDLTFGTYPYVTSSRVMTDAVGIGTGFSARKLDTVIGVYKAYTTRVGIGPFPSEFFDDTADYIRKTGNEYGSTTGRPRRIGWFDAVAGRYSARINALDNAVLTCLDVLTGIEQLKICTGYQYQGKIHRSMDLNNTQMLLCKPVYETLSGWDADISNCKEVQKLPLEARLYTEAIENYLHTPISLISVGRDREQTIKVKAKKR
ncbi:MAG: adenylosuccinate synthase [Candidatus Cloacimonas sp.]|jgi:adenylosuccinate synthase|nr:adenylosuccinate synthase [Candidatus Cloacimonas sp.]HNW24264.1 adenylosuccinate synthase [Candidatus Cloacimonas sp.]HNX02057.1 adenylosuccinate synthase [Candidatus Cloacimonas sp.]HPS60058.1 adenylosuccinate synthase [Candidatus Cloacimonas sp.]